MKICFIALFLFILEGNGLSLDSWKLVILFVIYAQKSIFYMLLFCINSNCITFQWKMDLVALISSLPFVDWLSWPMVYKKLVIFALPVLKFWYPILRTLVSSIAFTISVLSFQLVERFYSSWICSFVLCCRHNVKRHLVTEKFFCCSISSHCNSEFLLFVE